MQADHEIGRMMVETGTRDETTVVREVMRANPCSRVCAVIERAASRVTGDHAVDAAMHASTRAALAAPATALHTKQWPGRGENL